MLTPRIDLMAHLLQYRRSLKKQYSTFKKKSHVADKEIKKQTESEYKGYQFEQYIVSLFNRDYFHLLEWRSDKNVNDIYPLSCQFPDLEYYFTTDFESLHFAVECKYRQYITAGIVDLGKDYQLENYKLFEERCKIPVFIILGIGGDPNKPNEVYSIPLKEINNTHIHSITLTPYKRKNPHDPFFLNCSKQTLS